MRLLQPLFSALLVETLKKLDSTTGYVAALTVGGVMIIKENSVVKDY